MKTKFKETKFYRNVLSAIAHPKNFFFCLKYPFWKNRNVWTNEFMGYNFTLYEDIMPGWRKAFGKELSNEILTVGKKILKENKGQTWTDILYWEQIKQKWGRLCLYASAHDEISEILEKYEHMSIGYCENCGKPARYVTSGYVSFICEDCFEKELSADVTTPKNYVLTEEEKEKERKQCRLTKKDIPNLVQYSTKEVKVEKFATVEECRARQSELYDLNKDPDMCFRVDYNDSKSLHHEKTIRKKIDLKKKYGIDLKKLWGLK